MLPPDQVPKYYERYVKPLIGRPVRLGADEAASLREIMKTIKPSTLARLCGVSRGTIIAASKGWPVKPETIRKARAGIKRHAGILQKSS